MRWQSRLMCVLVVFLVSIPVLLPPEARGDWPAWRGPHRDGTARAIDVPSPWPAELTKRWSVTVGEGHSSPVIVGDRIYQFARVSERENLTCLNKDGETLWQYGYEAPYEMHPAARGHGKGPKSTPACGDGRVVTLGISGIVSCWNAADGQVNWRREFGSEFEKTSPLYGAAMSPLLLENRCIVHVGGHDQGALMALAADSGQAIWQWTKDGPAYASPIITGIASSPLIVTQTQQSCVGITPDGQTSWQFDYETDHDQNSITPVVAGQLLVITGHRRDIRAYRLVQQQGQVVPEEVWNNAELSCYMSTPVVRGESLFAFAQQDRGKLVRLDSTTGKLLWSGPPRQGSNASLVLMGELLLCLTTDSDLVIVDATADQYRELARYRLSSTPIWAHPAIDGRQLLVKDAESLTLWAIP